MNFFSPFYVKHISGIFMEIRQGVVKMWHLKMGKMKLCPFPPRQAIWLRIPMGRYNSAIMGIEIGE
jgi:hypothetical protein